MGGREGIGMRSGRGTRGRSRIAGLALAAAVPLLITACGPAPAPPAPSPDRTTSASPTAAASSTPSEVPPAAIVIPECEVLLPIDEARALFGGATEFFGETPLDHIHDPFEVPQTQAAVRAATQLRTCGWGVPNSDGGFGLVVGELAASDAAALRAALPAAGYSEVEMGTVTGYDADGEGEVSSIGATHLFTGDVWILCEGTSSNVCGAFAGLALQAMRSANPALGL